VKAVSQDIGSNFPQSESQRVSALAEADVSDRRGLIDLIIIEVHFDDTFVA
jgi:hypothetical protein